MYMKKSMIERPQTANGAESAVDDVLLAGKGRSGEEAVLASDTICGDAFDDGFGDAFGDALSFFGDAFFRGESPGGFFSFLGDALSGVGLTPRRFGLFTQRITPRRSPKAPQDRFSSIAARLTTS